MSPTSPRSRSRAAAQPGAAKPKTAKPRAAKAKKALAAKTAKPRAPRAAKPVQPAPAAQRELFVQAPHESQPRPAPARAPVPPRATAAAPAPAAVAPALAAREPEERRRSLLWIILIPLLMLGSFWIGRISSRTPAQDTITITAAAPSPAAATTASVAPRTAATPAQTTVAPAKKPGLIARFIARHRASATSLVEVSVGTTSRGGLTLRFDHPVAWQVNDPGTGDEELNVRGVRALGTFPRNLPLPPGVTSIRASITPPDTLNLRFGLQPGIHLSTMPGTGPAAALGVYFRTPAEEAEAATTAGAAEANGCGASNSPEAVKAATLLQRSLDKNPGYAPVREALALLETCAGDGAQAEQLLTTDTKDGGNGVKLAVTDVALRYARGDIDGALNALKSGMPAGDAGYQELLADLEAARQP